MPVQIRKTATIHARHLHRLRNSHFAFGGFDFLQPTHHRQHQKNPQRVHKAQQSPEEKKRKQKKGRVATQHLHQINTLPTRHVHTNKHLRHALRIAQLSLVGQEGFEELVREQHEVHGRGGDFRREGEHCRLVVGKLVVLDEAKGGVEGDGGGEGGDGEV